MATSQLISFYVPLTAPGPALGNKWHWIYKSTHTNTYTSMRTHLHKRTLYSKRSEQLLQFNTLHNNLFANWLGGEWRIIFRGLTIENRHSIIVCCHSPVVGLNSVPAINMVGWSVTVTLSLNTYM